MKAENLSHVSGKHVLRECNSCLLEVEKLPMEVKMLSHGSEKDVSRK
jgi:hypothetical protein